MNEITKELIQTNIELLKGILKKYGACIGFNKTEDKLIFFDKDQYLNNKKLDGFQIAISEFEY